MEVERECVVTVIRLGREDRAVLSATVLSFSWWGKTWQANLSLKAITHLGPSCYLLRYGDVAIVSLVIIMPCVVVHTYAPSDARRIMTVTQCKAILGVTAFFELCRY